MIYDAVGLIEYDKMSDDILYLADSTYLRFTIKTTTRAMNGRKASCIKEYKYNTTMYSNSNIAYTIRRSMHYYLSIENIKNKDFFIMITPKDILMLRASLNRAAQWISSDEVFMIKNKKLVMKKTQPITIPLSDGTVISFKPCVIEKNDGQLTQGVKLLHKKLYISIPADTFYGLVYTIGEFNMYQSASIMMNYLPRKFGENIIDFTDGSPDYKYRNEVLEYQEEIEPPSSGGRKKRMPRGQTKPISIDDL